MSSTMNIIRRAILAVILIAGLGPAFAQAPPPVPALPDTERRTSYSISSSNCACAVNFAIYGDSTDVGNWVEVWLNGISLSSADPVYGWSLTSPTGPLAAIPRPVTDAVLNFNAPQTGTVQIVGARRPRRVSQFGENRGVAARDLNQALTDIVAQNREVWDKINDTTGRVPRAPAGETLAMLPMLANRANMGACFDSGGNLTSCVSAPGSSSLLGASPIVISGTNPTQISCPTCITTVAVPAVPWTNSRLAKASAYAAISSDCGDTIALGGSAFYALSISAPSGYIATCAYYVVNEDSSAGKTISISGLNSFILWPLQSVTIFRSGSVWQAQGVSRWILPSATTVNVDNVNGSDSSDGLASGTRALKTFAQAWSNIAGKFDLNNQVVTIQLASGQSWSNLATTILPLGSSPAVIIDGAGDTISGTGGLAAIQLNHGGSPIPVRIQNMTLTSSGGGACFAAGTKTLGLIGAGVTFGSSSTGYQILAATQSVITAINNYTISGGGNAHFYADAVSMIDFTVPITVTITGNPTFTQFAVATMSGLVYTPSVTWSGTATTSVQRYFAALNGVINTNGQGINYYPGSNIGNATAGGQYN